MLGLGTRLALVGLLILVACSSAHADTRPLFSGRLRDIIDATQVFSRNTPGDVSYNLHPTHLLRTATALPATDYYFKESYTLAGGSGTHMDSHAHLRGLAPGIRTISDYNATELFSPLVVINVCANASVNPDYAVSVADLQRWEQTYNRRIPDGAFVAMNSCWWAKYNNEFAYRNNDNGVPVPTPHFPGFSDAAAQWLIANRNIHAIGVDTLSGDIGATWTYGAHYAILDGGKYIVENLNLGDPHIPAAGAYIQISPLKIDKAPEAPARALIYLVDSN